MPCRDFLPLSHSYCSTTICPATSNTVTPTAHSAQSALGKKINAYMSNYGMKSVDVKCRTLTLQRRRHKYRNISTLCQSGKGRDLLGSLLIGYSACQSQRAGGCLHFIHISSSFISLNSRSAVTVSTTEAIILIQIITACPGVFRSSYIKSDSLKESVWN